MSESDSKTPEEIDRVIPLVKIIVVKNGKLKYLNLVEDKIVLKNFKDEELTVIHATSTALLMDKMVYAKELETIFALSPFADPSKELLAGLKEHVLDIFINVPLSKADHIEVHVEESGSKQ